MKKIYKMSKMLLILMLIMVFQSCNNIDSDFGDNDDFIKSSNEDTKEDYSSDINLDYEGSDDDTLNLNIAENSNEDFLNISKIIYYSEDNTISAYVYSIDLSQKNSVEIAVEYNGEKVILPLSANVNSLYDILFINEHRIGITGHINPSLLSHEVFDIYTGELISSFYGTGFIYDENYKLYYVVPQPHWVGIDDRGGNLIMNEQGDVLYETESNIMIYGDLRIESGIIYFSEKSADPNNDSSEIVLKSINID